MTGGDEGTTVYAYTSGFVMNAAGMAKLYVQLQQLGIPAETQPQTVGLPPGAQVGPLPDPVGYALTIGVTTRVDSKGGIHPAGTWASLVTTGVEFPKGGIYNTTLWYRYAGGSPITQKQSPILILNVDTGVI